MRKQRKLLLLVSSWLVALTALVAVPTPVSADGGPTSLAYISPAERGRAEAKQHELERLLAARARDKGVHSNVDYGQVTMSLWQEPQSGAGTNNWCGPGSTTAVVGQWRGNAVVDNYSGSEGLGPDAYMAHLANTLGEYDGVQTSLDSYLRVTNNQIGSSWYVGSNPADFNDYKNKLWYEIQVYGHPLADVVNANGLPGWNKNVAHWVTTKQYWVSGNTTTYGDTAGTHQGRSMGANWNIVNLDDFYNNHVAPITQLSFNLIVY